MPESTTRLDRAEELAILNTIAKELNRSVDLNQALTTVLIQVARLLGLETSWIFLLEEASGESYLAASHNLPPRSAKAQNGWREIAIASIPIARAT